MTKTRLVICPYCGETQHASERCRACSGLFEPLSRQATHNTMGPWFVRNPQRPFQPGCSYETLVRLIERGVVTKYSIIRGPTTRQFWTIGRHVPGVAHLLGFCHACDATVDPDDHGCPNCGVPFGAYLDRNYLGLPEVRPLPWEAPEDEERDTAPTPGLAWSRGGLRGKRLSSFAPDEELLAGAGGAMPQLPHVAPEPGEAGAPQHLPESSAQTSAGAVAAPSRAPAAEAHSKGEENLTSPAMRSMQRRLARQQRTIRLLIVLVILLAAAGAIINLAAVMPRGGAGPDGAGRAADRDSAAVSDRADSAGASGAAEPEEDGEPESSVLDADDDGTGDATRGVDIEEPVIEEEPVVSDDERYVQALSLAKAAEGADRSLDDRIADLERALALLRELEADEAAEKPADLAEQIQRIADEIEYLDLKRFFP